MMRLLQLAVVIAAPIRLAALGVASEKATDSAVERTPHGKHHRRHHHHKKAHAQIQNSTAASSATNSSVVNLLHSARTETHTAANQQTSTGRGELEVNGPLPADFADMFAKEIAKATGCKPEQIKVLTTNVVEGHVGVDEVTFEAPPEIVKAVEDQAADPDSKLATGPLRIFLIEKSSEDADSGNEDASAVNEHSQKHGAPAGLQADSASIEGEETESEETPVEDKGIDIDTAMPYGELEPFGREDTAQELTKGSIRESDGMVDQLERAEVAEEKRAVFRALTRLRGAAITSFDGIARSQTGNIDKYARTNHWRPAHPVRHLADEESDVQKWAFPDSADF